MGGCFFLESDEARTRAVVRVMEKKGWARDLAGEGGQEKEAGF